MTCDVCVVLSATPRGCDVPHQGEVHGSPAVGRDGTVFFGSDDKNLYAVNGQNGSLVWSYLTQDAVQVAPVVGADGSVYFGSTDGNFYCLSAAGELQWHANLEGSTQVSAAVGVGGLVIVGFKSNSM